MPVALNLTDLMDYTDWERQKWHDWLKQQGDDALKISAGPHGDGRFSTVGDLIKHIFSAEKRYVDRLSDRPLTDPASIPNDTVEGLFLFSRRSRKDLRQFIDTYPAQKWDAMMEFDFMGGILRATPKKIATHVLLHEIRHWAQIATLFRLTGLKGEFHDFLGSPVFGGDFRRPAAKT
jgi:uncharacterized damage-inducible protein DinB